MTRPEAEAHRLRMQRRQQVQHQRLQERTVEKGLLLVHTGDGKGKTTAALGMVLRTLGHGERVAVVQFIKGAWEPGEALALRRFDDLLVWRALGEGFTWETQDLERDRHLVDLAWQESLGHLRDPAVQLVLLDELNVALRLGYIAVDDVLAGLAERPRHPCRGDGPRGTGRPDRAGGPRDRDDPGASPVPGAGCQGAEGDRVLIRQGMVRPGQDRGSGATSPGSTPKDR